MGLIKLLVTILYLYFFKDGPFTASFSSFSSFILNVQLVDKILPVLGFKPRISGVGSDRSTK